MTEPKCETRTKIVEIMKKKNLTVNAIARQMGKRESAVRAWLYGQREDAKISTLEAVAKVMGVKIRLVTPSKKRSE